MSFLPGAVVRGRKLLLLSSGRRWSSGGGGGGQWVTVETDAKDDRIAVLSMNRPPVNSLNLEMLLSFTSAIDDLEERLDSLDGIIITSKNDSVFTAGLDLSEMHRPDKERLTSFWSAVQRFWMRLYGCKVTVASAIAGHAPAGGTLIALCSDHRVVVDNPKLRMGLNEVLLGLAPPTWLFANMASTIGPMAAERSVKMGTMFAPKEALEIGLVDELAADRDEAVEKCRRAIGVYAKAARPRARGFAKMFARQPLIKALEDSFDKDLRLYVDAISSDYCQGCIDKYLSSLSKKKPK